jgi:tetratricopeptide (TPR) repeat protein
VVVGYRAISNDSAIPQQRFPDHPSKQTKKGKEGKPHATSLSAPNFFCCRIPPPVESGVSLTISIRTEFLIRDNSTVKQRNWLTLTEYLLLLGTGVGSVAAAATVPPLLLTAAPMSVLFLLNLINRRKLAQDAEAQTAGAVTGLDQKLSADISSLQQQVQVLPNFLDLASLKKAVLTKGEEGFNELSQELAQLKQELGKPEWRLLRQELRQLQDRYSSLSDSVGQIAGQLNRLSGAGRVDNLELEIAQLKSDLSNLRVNIQNLSDEQRINNHRVLQDQIEHLNRRLNKLPTPVDVSSLKQDVDSLVKMMGEMVSRRELAKITAQVEKLDQQNDFLEQTVNPLKVATAILKKQLDTLGARVDAREEVSERLLETALVQSEPPMLESLRVTVNSLEQRLNQLPPNADLSLFRSEMQAIVSTQLAPLQQQLVAVQQFTQTLDRQHKTLRDWVNHLPQSLDNTALQNEVKYLASRVEWAETNVLDMQSQVESTVKSHLQEATQQLQASIPTPKFELIFDLKTSPSQPGQAAQSCSQAVLEEALNKAQSRLIVVYPYPNPETLNTEMLQQFRRFLDRWGCLDIGWGHLGEVTSQSVCRAIDRRRSLNATEKGFLYDTLNQLTQLKRQYPNQFRFKVLGTNENFLVCDRTFAILGTQSITNASKVYPETAVGLRTTDLDVIQALITRFDDPTLDESDASAYFNRATTRYDLGDRQGAIADYTEVLRIHPNDAAYNNRALARYDLGDLQGAIEDLNQAVQTNPSLYVAYCNRGFVRSEMGDKLGAIEDYTIALQINPDYSTAYFYRGLARTRLQNKLGAIQDYTEVIRLNPEDATAHFYRGLASIKLGYRLEATKDLQKAAQLFSEQEDSTNYQQTIRTLQKLHQSLVLAGQATPSHPNG